MKSFRNSKKENSRANDEANAANVRPMYACYSSLTFELTHARVNAMTDALSCSSRADHADSRDLIKTRCIIARASRRLAERERVREIVSRGRLKREKKRTQNLKKKGKKERYVTRLCMYNARSRAFPSRRVGWKILITRVRARFPLVLQSRARPV